MLEFASVTKHFDSPTNRLYTLRDRLIAENKKIADLVSGQGNRQSILFPQHVLKGALGQGMRHAKTYAPNPLGQKKARASVQDYYDEQDCRAPADQIVLTPGTSVSYWYVFKTLADAGDEILTPVPSYPLFDSIASLCDVKLVSYPLRESHGWSIDFDALERAITPRTRAVALISPHNPTGAVAAKDDVDRLAALAKARSLAIISDEVFSPFVYGQEPFARPAKTDAPLVFTLNGFSKMLALPGLKFGWIVVTGESTLVSKTLRALEMISDTFLPVNEVVQAAVPTLWRSSRAFLKRYVRAMRERRDLAADILQTPAPQGGFFFTCALKRDEEDVACELLEKKGLLVHPGYLYDMEGEHLVFSFASGASALRKNLSAIGAALR